MIKDIFLFLIIGLMIMALSGCSFQDESSSGLMGSSYVINEYENPILKYHNNDTVDTNNTLWNNITWTIYVSEESTAGKFYLDDNNTSIVFTEDGVYNIQGCTHIINNLGSVDVGKVLVRTMLDGIESRCTQASKSKSFRSNGVDSLPYFGTIRVVNGSKVQVQYMVNNVGLDFGPDLDFDRPVTFTVSLEKISN